MVANIGWFVIFPILYFVAFVVVVVVVVLVTRALMSISRSNQQIVQKLDELAQVLREKQS
jgi:uncharacterized membrane protein